VVMSKIGSAERTGVATMTCRVGPREGGGDARKGSGSSGNMRREGGNGRRHRESAIVRIGSSGIRNNWIKRINARTRSRMRMIVRRTGTI
jgi:hypothetical protein